MRAEIGGLDWLECAKLACALGLLSTSFAIVYLVRELVGEEARARRLSLAAVAVTVLNPYSVHWSFSGMESVTALGLSLWAIWAVFVRPAAWGSLLAGALLLGVGPLLRPELLLLAGFGGPVVLWRYWRLSQKDAALRRWSRLALLASLMLLPDQAFGENCLNRVEQMAANYGTSTDPPTIPLQFTLAVVAGTRQFSHAQGTIALEGVWEFVANPSSVSGSLSGSLAP